MYTNHNSDHFLCKMNIFTCFGVEHGHLGWLCGVVWLRQLFSLTTSKKRVLISVQIPLSITYFSKVHIECFINDIVHIYICLHQTNVWCTTSHNVLFYYVSRFCKHFVLRYLNVLWHLLFILLIYKRVLCFFKYII